MVWEKEKYVFKSIVSWIVMSKVSERNPCWGIVNIILRGRNPIWYNWFFVRLDPVLGHRYCKKLILVFFSKTPIPNIHLTKGKERCLS